VENYVVYWVHLPEHTDYNTQGYIGITNNFNKRLVQHKRKPPNPHFRSAILKYSWDNLVKEAVVINIDKEAAILLEEMLRPKENIGWNTAMGGGVAPSWLGKRHSEETRLKMSAWQVGKILSDETRYL